MGMKQAAQRVKEISTRSVINSLLWLPGVLILVLGAVAFREHANPVIVWGLLAVLAFLSIAVVVAYGYFALVSPDRLQSEQHIEKVLQLQLSQGKDGPVTIEARPATSNPRTRQQKAILKEDRP